MSTFHNILFVYFWGFLQCLIPHGVSRSSSCPLHMLNCLCILCTIGIPFCPCDVITLTQLTVWINFCTCRGGLPRGTDPRCLPETARLCGVPNPGEGLPSRVSGQLPGGSRRARHLLHPPPQQTQEIHLPVHRWLLFCSGGGESGQMRLYKVFVKIKIKKETTPSADTPPPHMFLCSYPLYSTPIPLIQGPDCSLHNPTPPPSLFFCLLVCLFNNP